MKKTILLIASAIMACSCAYDDSNLINRIDDIDGRLTKLESAVKQLNTDIATLQGVVNSLSDGKVITATQQTADGYVLTMSDGTKLTLSNGTNGQNGADGQKGVDAPVIGVKADGGIYYWTLTDNGQTSFLTDSSGARLPVSGNNGNSGVTPVMGVDADGYWTVNYGSGATRILDSQNRPISAHGEKGDSIFSSFTDEGDSIKVTLANGTVLSIAKAVGLTLSMEANQCEEFPFGVSRTFALTLSREANISIVKPDGWKARYDNGTLTVTAPVETNTFAETSGRVTIIATVAGQSAQTGMDVVLYRLRTLDFEEFDGSEYLAESAYGSNYYGSVTFWSSQTGLMSEINNGDFGQAFYSGGIALSQWNDMLTVGYTNQMSAYYTDPVTGLGGHNGSKTFAVHYGNNNPQFSDCRSKIWYEDETTQVMFESMWICNNTYSYLSMAGGDSFMGTPLNYDDKDWFKLIITGYDNQGVETGTIEYYLADFRTADAPGIVTGWQKVDLSSLGRVNRLGFDMNGTHDNGYGTAIPVYCCMDDLVMRLYAE